MTANPGISVIRGACPHDCPDGCALVSEVENDRVVRFTGDPEHPITQGWLCAKVRPYLDRVYAPDRLMHPLRRTGPKGADQWERISWGEAIGEISERWRTIIADYGAAAILPYSYSGTLGLVEMGVASTRLWNRLGASGLERSICDAAANAAIAATLGAKTAPDPRDVAFSKLIILWGHNPSTTSPHFVPILRDAQRNGTFVVVVDPRRTRTARSADLHIQPNPATDAALALGLMHVIFAEDAHDEMWLEANTVGWRDLKKRAGDYPPARVENITGVPASEIVSLAKRWADSTPAMLKFSDGVQRHQNGGQTIRALLAIPALTGQYGRKGGGLFYSQSGHIPWNAEAVGHDSECPPVPRVVNMNRLGAALNGEIADPPIKSLFVFGANPVASTPNSAAIVRGLQRDDLLTVVHEQFLTDTALFADIVLPATSQLEQTDVIKPYGHRHLQYNQQAISPLGESKSNWTVMKLLAKAMGFSDSWFDQSNEEVIREVLNATRAGNRRLTGVTFERLREEGTIPYFFDDSDYVPFADLHFPTPSGKIELRCEAMTALGVDPLPEYVEPNEFEGRGSDQLVLLSGAAHHFVSSSMANQTALLHKEGAPSIELHPADAAERSIADDDQVLVENDRGWCLLTAKVTTDVKIGTAVSPKGYWAKLSTGNRNVNWLTSDALADLGNQATFHSNLVTVRTLTMTEYEQRCAEPVIEHSAVAD